MTLFSLHRLKDLFSDPLYLLVRLLSCPYILYIRFHPRINCGSGLVLKGKPIVEILNNGKIILKNNVTLYSTPRNYFAQLASPTRLFVEGETAIIQIGNNSRINGATIHARSQIFIGDNCLIAANTSILDSNGHEAFLDQPENRINSKDEPKNICIEDNVWVGINSIILKGVTIGTGSIVSAGSVVVRDVPSHCVVRGNPAVVIKTLSHDHQDDYKEIKNHSYENDR